MNYDEFINCSKSLLIAPAGFGKTHSIAESLNYTKGKQLILTHTHAGIDSLKRKIDKLGISSRCYHVETISGYAQKYVKAFVHKNKIPLQSDPNYYEFIITNAINLFTKPIIKKIVTSTYTGLFVDEYQDCTFAQHKLISILSDLLPTHIVGDPLQGIFTFQESTVDLTSPVHLHGFSNNTFKLETPWRWKGLNEKLGNSLKEIRELLLSKQAIDLNKLEGIEIQLVSDYKDLYKPKSEYQRQLYKILKEKNLLLIHPVASNVAVREKIIRNFKVPITLIEAIDDKDFYRLAHLCDSINDTNFDSEIFRLCESLFSSTALKEWITTKGLVKKKKHEENQKVLELLKNKLNQFRQTFALIHLAEFLKLLFKVTDVNIYRQELFKNVCSSLSEATIDNRSVHQVMEDKRNTVRRIGRQITGKCIGTTLLTKGLEFETVVVLNANEFPSPQNLYVALTRASKRLIIFSTTSILNPFKS